MKRIVSGILMIAMLLSMSVALVGCDKKEADTKKEGEQTQKEYNAADYDNAIEGVHAYLKQNGTKDSEGNYRVEFKEDDVTFYICTDTNGSGENADLIGLVWGFDTNFDNGELSMQMYMDSEQKYYARDAFPNMSVYYLEMQSSQVLASPSWKAICGTFAPSLYPSETSVKWELGGEDAVTLFLGAIELLRSKGDKLLEGTGFTLEDFEL